MGNRGILHNEEQRVVRPWVHKSWIACSPSYPGSKQAVFSPGTYSQLFFLDEATAFAAGHRPCSTCRRNEYIGFKAAWLKANMPDDGTSFVRVSEIDKVLHAERAIPGGAKQVFEAALSELPSGAMFEFNSSAFLLLERRMLRWSFDGYTAENYLSPDTLVQVLTPKSIVRMLQSGYPLGVHESAQIFI